MRRHCYSDLRRRNAIERLNRELAFEKTFVGRVFKHLNLANMVFWLGVVAAIYILMYGGLSVH
jgi:hypothetical protein